MQDILNQDLDNYLSDAYRVPTVALSGNLALVSLADVIQMFAHGSQAGVIRVVSERYRGSIWFDAGVIMRAELGARCGEHAFYAAMLLDEGTFEVVIDAACPASNLETAAYPLLMEGARRFDECNRIRAELGLDEVRLVRNDHTSVSPGLDAVVAHMFDAPCSVDLVLSLCALGELEALEAVKRMLTEGALAVVDERPTEAARLVPDPLLHDTVLLDDQVRLDEDFAEVA